MGYVQTVTLIGGTKDGTTIRYGEPLPNTIVYQHHTPNGWRCEDYQRVGDTTVYRTQEQP